MPSILVRLPVTTRYRSTTKPSRALLTNEEALRNRKCNQQLPIFSLFPDLLEYIFLLAVDHESDSYILRRTIVGWSHTCHYWRAVTQSIKALWARLIDFDDRSYRWNQEMLRLSYPLPIEASFSGDLSMGTQTLALQSSHLDRIQRYSIAFPDIEWDFLVRMLERPAPSLVSLHITCRRSFGPLRHPPPLLPSNLFAGQAPCLRQLSMNECLIDFRSPLFSSLVRLRVTNLHRSDSPSALEWLKHLCEMPSLSELVLDNAMFPSSRPSAPSSLSWDRGDEGRYPQITNLIVEAPAAEVSVLLRFLPMPKHCNWTATCHECSPGAPFDAIIHTFSESVRTSDSKKLSPILIIANEYDIYLRNESISDDYSSVGCLSFFLHATAHHHWDTLFPSVANGLSDAISRVTSLEVNMPTLHPSLLSLLRHAVHLKTLARLSAKMSKNLFRELLKPVSSGLGNSDIFLPKLERLTFMDDGLLWGESYQSFIAFLKWRLEVCAPIQVVHFTQCCILESVLKEMMMLGVEVEVGMDGFRWQNC